MGSDRLTPTKNGQLTLGKAMYQIEDEDINRLWKEHPKRSENVSVECALPGLCLGDCRQSAFDFGRDLQIMVRRSATT